jgi:hypothetical protein
MKLKYRLYYRRYSGEFAPDMRCECVARLYELDVLMDINLEVKN